MKLTLRRLVMPLVIFSFIATGCNKSKDLSNKTSITVSCVRIGTSTSTVDLGTEVTITRQEDGSRYTQFAIVPATVTFGNLEPGKYQVAGQNTNSLSIESIEVQKDDQEVVSLMYN
jgi:hypothetical protein